MERKGIIELVRFNPEHKQLWNDFVESSKNGTFLFNREYMDYHSNRFKDNSYLIYRKGKLYSLLPANVNGDTLYSHQGLTYGGLIMSTKCTAEGILDVFDVLMEDLKKNGVKKFIYKPVPHIYHSIPAEEDLYAMFRHRAKLSVRNISSTIFQRRLLPLIKDRRAALRRAESNNLKIEGSTDFKSFWKILEDNLREKYGAKPIHSLKEIELLASGFPHNIVLYMAKKENIPMGGIICFITKNVCHTQYISATKEGKELGAIDAIVNFLVNDKYAGIPYFDFGTSNEDGGRFLNESLIYQKEGFGGRGICYDTYEINF